MPIAEVNGQRLFYQVDGPEQGPAVLFISGLGSDHRRWERIAGPLAGRYRCITFDNRDCGRSGRATAFYAIGDMARDAASLLQALGVAAAHVVGYSMGGAIAQALALDFPRRVRSLTLIATYSSGDPRGTAIFDGFGQLRQRLSREEYAHIIFPWLYTVQDYHRPGFIEEALRRSLEDPLYQEQEAYERQSQATTGFFCEDRLGEIACPTLLVFGEDDLLTPLRFARKLHEEVRGSRLVVLAGAGHGLLATRAEVIGALIEGFLGEQGDS